MNRLMNTMVAQNWMPEPPELEGLVIEWGPERNSFGEFVQRVIMAWTDLAVTCQEAADLINSEFTRMRSIQESTGTDFEPKSPDNQEPSSL